MTNLTQAETAVGTFNANLADDLAALPGIERDPKILSGVPVFRGTRFTLTQLLVELADSDAVDEIAENYDVDAKTLRQTIHALSIQLNQPVR